MSVSKVATENISVTVPIDLLELFDLYCSEADLNRSQAVNRAIRLYLATKICKEPTFWQEQYKRFQDKGKI